MSKITTMDRKTPKIIMKEGESGRNWQRNRRNDPSQKVAITTEKHAWEAKDFDRIYDLGYPNQSEVFIDITCCEPQLMRTAIGNLENSNLTKPSLEKDEDSDVNRFTPFEAIKGHFRQKKGIMRNSTPSSSVNVRTPSSLKLKAWALSRLLLWGQTLSVC